jgi:hypothetical protein
MTRFFYGKIDVVRFVEDQLRNLEHGFALTTTIRPGKSGGYCVTTVIEELSGDTEHPMVRSYSPPQLNT